jgi:hypothetical protein
VAQLGEADMKAGDHTLDIRLTASKNEKAKCSAFCTRATPL